MSRTSARQMYLISGKAVELWENSRQPFGWTEEDLDGYAKLGHWDLLFNALVLAHVLDGPSAA